jgi:hypothetical protein
MLTSCVLHVGTSVFVGARVNARSLAQCRASNIFHQSYFIATIKGDDLFRLVKRKYAQG